MKTRIDETFQRLAQAGESALIGYVTAGYPARSSLEALVPQLESAGVDILEIGVPFSDPIADGPTIQQSSQAALSNGVTLDWTLRAVQRLRRRVSLPLVLMSYTNPIHRMGVDTFFRRARAAGVDGLIMPDAIPESAAGFQQAADQAGISIIWLASPTTPLARVKRLAELTRGFLYVVSVTGVTGARSQLPAHLEQFVARVKRVSPVPVAVGFGISTPAQARRVGRIADGVIVGSALIKSLRKNGDPRDAVRLMSSLKKELRHASRKQ